MKRYWLKFKKDFHALLIGLGFSQLITALFFLAFQEVLEKNIAQYMEDFPPHRIHLLANLVFPLYLMCGLGLITVGCYKLWQSVKTRNPSL